MTLAVAIFVAVAGLLSVGQESLNLAGMTSPVEVQFEGIPTSMGTGFFFQVLDPGDPQKPNQQWRRINSTFLVTNRHVVQLENWQKLKSLTFSLRRFGSNGGSDWIPISLDKSELGRRLHLHPDTRVDVIAVDVLDLMWERFKASSNQADPHPILQWNAVSHEELPGVSKLTVSEGDDVVVVGYPRAFYDEYNKLPVLKRGMLASPWGTKYRGQDAFLIDYKFFHGSSGSPVISQPVHFAVENGQPVYSSKKQFLFLGVYSGEPFLLGPMTDTDEEVRQEKIKADMGVVWYLNTIEEAIKNPAFVH